MHDLNIKSSDSVRPCSTNVLIQLPMTTRYYTCLKKDLMIITLKKNVNTITEQ